MRLRSKRCCKPIVSIWGGLFLVLSTQAHGQTIWYVDDDNCPGPGVGTESDPFCKIQAGIDAAMDGDEVVVAEGYYVGINNQDLSFGGKAITVRGTSPLNWSVVANTIINGRGFNIHQNETSASLLTGVTITGGANDSIGGAIICDGSSPTISNCRIIMNQSRRGGGIACTNGSAPTIVDCRIAMNRVIAGQGRGGGVSSENSSPTLSGCSLTRNSASVSSGGIGSSSSVITLTRCEIIQNTAPSAGGISLSGGIGIIDDCRLTSNDSGAFLVSGVAGTTAMLRNTTIDQNQDSGGLSIASSSQISVTLDNCLFYQNSTNGDGGAVMLGEFSSLTVNNCTIADNLAGGNGGGLFCSNGQSITVTDAIIWGNQPNQFGSCSALTAAYSDIQDGWPGTGNINQDPLFVSGPLGDYYLSQQNAGQPSQSPCVDMGSDTAANLQLDTQTTRTDEVLDSGFVDMGVHVNKACLGDVNGDGVVDAFDLAVVLGAWGMTGPPCPPYSPGDLNFDCVVNPFDLAIVLGAWGSSCSSCGGQGDCSAIHFGPGCNDKTCCAEVCEHDSYCCDEAWDEFCVLRAAEDCYDCSQSSGDCSVPNGTPGCDEPFCCSAVCSSMPECCQVNWDQRCANVASVLCGCSSSAGSCCAPNPTPGCNDEACCDTICGKLGVETCCDDEWTAACAQLADAECDICQ